MADERDPAEDIANILPDGLVWRRPDARVYGHLYVTEHRNYGELQLDSPIEPADKTTKHAIGGEPIQVARETRCVALLSTYPCRVSFVPEGQDLEDAEGHAFPLAADNEVTRTLHPNTSMQIVSFPGY